MLDVEVKHTGEERRQSKTRSQGDRRLWLRREQADRRYGKGRRVWNRRVSETPVEHDARSATQRSGTRRRATVVRREGPIRREDSRRRSDRRIA